jgi:hypothetical protein
MRDVFRALDRVADRLARDLDCKPAQSKAQPPLKYHRRRAYFWRAPDAKPVVQDVPIVTEVERNGNLVPPDRRSARPRHVNKRRTKW